MQGQGQGNFCAFGTARGFWETKKLFGEWLQMSPVGFLARAFCYIAWEFEGARRWPTHSASLWVR